MKLAIKTIGLNCLIIGICFYANVGYHVLLWAYTDQLFFASSLHALAVFFIATICAAIGALVLTFPGVIK